MYAGSEPTKGMNIPLLYHFLWIPYLLVTLILRSLALLQWVIIAFFLPSTPCFSELRVIQLQYAYENWTRRVTGCPKRPIAPESQRCQVLYFLLPSLAIWHSEEHEHYLAKGKQMTDGLDSELAHCKRLMDAVRVERRGLIEKSVDHLESMNVDQLSTYIKTASCIKDHIEQLEAERCKIISIAATQAVCDQSGYRGLSDWSQCTLHTHKDLIEALCQVSFVGAGLTYSSVFSANRGNVGLMCYAFALFNCGFTIPLVTLALLKWASNLPANTLFARPQMWSFITNIFIYLSVGAVVAAICLLNVTIIFLIFGKDSEGVLQDSPVEFNIPPRPAGVFALVCAVTTVCITLLALFLHYCANGWHTLTGAFVGRRHEPIPQKLDSFVMV